MSVKNKLTSIISSVLGANTSAYKEEHVKYLREREQLKQEVLADILQTVESGCREFSEIHYNKYMFEESSPHLFEESLGSEVLKELEYLGYKCIMSFNPTYLTIKGW